MHRSLSLRNHQFELWLSQIPTLLDLGQKRICNAVAGGLALNKMTVSVAICASPLLLLGNGSILACGSEQILQGIIRTVCCWPWLEQILCWSGFHSGQGVKDQGASTVNCVLIDTEQHLQTLVKAQAIPTSAQHQNHPLLSSQRERSSNCKADRIIWIEKAESFLCLGAGGFFFLLAGTEGELTLALSS